MLFFRTIYSKVNLKVNNWIKKHLKSDLFSSFLSEFTVVTGEEWEGSSKWKGSSKRCSQCRTMHHRWLQKGAKLRQIKFWGDYIKRTACCRHFQHSSRSWRKFLWRIFQPNGIRYNSKSKNGVYGKPTIMVTQIVIWSTRYSYIWVR